MITITLENERNQVIEKIGEHDNREYLLKYTDNPAYADQSAVRACRKCVE